MMNIENLKKLFIRIMLYIALLPYILTILLFMSSMALDIYGRHAFRNSFIKHINTPNYPDAERILREFASYENGTIVSFETIPNGRPIIIEEMTDMDEKLFPSAAGVAFPKITSCKIILNKNLDDSEIRETLIHEYLHCYGYEHVPDPSDIMFYSLNSVDKYESIREYARKLKEDFYE